MRDDIVIARWMTMSLFDVRKLTIKERNTIISEFNKEQRAIRKAGKKHGKR